jgi:DNA processing protein
MSEAGYWIGLSLVPNVGPVMSKKLLAEMGTPENIFNAGLQDLLSVKGLNREKAENIRNFRLWDYVEKQLSLVEKKGIRVVACADTGYPQALKETEGAPIVLGRVSSGRPVRHRGRGLPETYSLRRGGDPEDGR